MHPVSEHVPAPQPAPVFDGHNDLPWALRQDFGYSVAAATLDQGQPRLHTDIPRLHAGGVGAQFWSVFVPSTLAPAESAVATLEQIDCVRRIVDAHPDTFELATSAAEVRAAVARGRIASLMGAEGGHSIAGSLAVLRMLADLGVRYMTLTHNDDLPWATSATGALMERGADPGLSPFGREVVAEMNRIGMLVDLSHVSPQTMLDALAATTRPVVFSHSSTRAVCGHPRNVPDEVLELLPANGGVLMVTFVPKFVSEACREHALAVRDRRRELGLPTGFHDVAPEEDPDAAAEFAEWLGAHPAPEATIDDVVRHLEHSRDVVGPQHLGLGGDFDGTTDLPRGMDGVAGYAPLLAALTERGWAREDLDALCFGNAMRVLEAAEAPQS
ncbi:dipeptidase [Sinomonas cellulolyticus]|uniref:Dipeptidase n=1 Tax=Sinomonas cellulolyticus TaxID=2801916 RepID=A0ABS1JZE6_9MICC|nr:MULTISPECIES: dipeptidase [Sinomonas]MBL0704022.1 dipeptidase [Sinomonas cellulolyticus]GHG59263.1 dipeptidase [Sinomonas sp. KCTC 49339]